MAIESTICDLWKKQIHDADEDKQQKFGKAAERAWGFLGKGFTDLYKDLYTTPEGNPFPNGQPFHKCRRNLSREFCNVYLPYLHHRVPNRQVAPRRPMPPSELKKYVQNLPAPENEQISAWLLQWWLNYLPTEYGLQDEVRPVIQEALVKGRGVWVHEMVPGPRGMIPSSLGDSVDNWGIDPNTKKVRDAGWMYRLRERSVWSVAEEYHIPGRELQGKYQAFLEQKAGKKQTTGKDRPDLCAYYEIYTRGVGIGQKFQQTPDELKAFGHLNEQDNAWLVIMPGVDYPLNLSPWIKQQGPDIVAKALKWPIPFYTDPANPWPTTFLDFYPNGDDPWATSPLEAALPLQSFIDHAYSFLFCRVRATCRDIIILSELLDLTIVNAIHYGLDQEIVFTAKKDVDEIKKHIHIVQFPKVNADLWKVIHLAERAFERMTGMDPLLYGAQPGPTQIRSSAEVQIRQQGVSSRPNDFADAVEACNSRLAAKEGFMTRLFVESDQVSGLFADTPQIPQSAVGNDQIAPGPLTQLWATLIETDDPKTAAVDYTYTIEAGSGRRKNIQKAVQDSQQLVQTLMPAYQQLAMHGAIRPFNELVQLVGNAMETDVSQIMLDQQDIMAIAMQQQQGANTGADVEPSQS